MRFLILISLLLLGHAAIVAQASSPFKLVSGANIRGFISELNENGKLGYRLKTLAKEPMTSQV